MKKQLQVIAIIIVFAFLFTGCSTGTINNEKTTVITRADYPYYEDESAIYKKASLVIRGTVIDKRMEYMSQVIELTEEEKNDPKLNPGGDVDEEKELVTIYKIQIIDSFKGDAVKGDIVEVKQFGGETNDTIYIEEGAPEIRKNSEYIMFLETYKDSPATLLNNVQSLYNIEDGKIMNHVDNDFNVTIEKLNKLSNNEKLR